MIEPCPETMLAHLEHVFGGDLDGCHEGQIELRFLHPGGSASQWFGTDQFEDLARPVRG